MCSATPARFRTFSVEGTRLNRQRIDDMVDRSLMLVTALSPVIGYDKASAIAHEANDEGLVGRAYMSKQSIGPLLEERAHRSSEEVLELQAA